jgi:hypothetical protein
MFRESYAAPLAISWRGRCNMNKLFPVNEHPVERVVRVLVGIALVGLTLAGKIGAWGWIGVLPILTGLLGSCLLYTALGISTCRAKAAGT